MPSGYTEKLYNGEQSFTDFVLRAARGMGAAIHQRDDGEGYITHRTASDYHTEALEKANTEMIELDNRSHEEWVEAWRTKKQEIADYEREYIEKRKAMQDRYLSMLGEVALWQPPTEEHEGLKQFMIDQLKQSLDFDTYYGRESRPAYHDDTADGDVDDYMDRVYAQLERNIQYHLSEQVKEEERVRSQNEWVDQLALSLGVTVG